MKLSTTDAEHFFNLMWPLQFYVNQRLQISPYLNTFQEYKAASMEEKMPIRTAVYENLPLIDDFISENPAQLPNEDLAIIQGWRKHAIVGDFFIERFLKKGAIFLGQDEADVYQVLGLHESLEEMFGGAAALPVRVQTVLLPFKGQIIYDGLMSMYRIYFGSGVSSELRESYMAAKQNGRIITNLEAKSTPEIINLPTKEWQKQAKNVTNASNKLKGRKNAPVQSQAFSVLRASAELVETAVSTPNNLDELWDLHTKLQRALNRLETVLHRAD
jgi:hypothetical protein